MKKYESEKIKMQRFSALVQWNQTFSLDLHNGLEKIKIKVFLSSIVIGVVEVDFLEL